MEHVSSHSDSEIRHEVYEPEEPVTVGHVIRVVKAYRAAIALVLISLTLVFLVFALLFYLSSRSETVTMQSFRLEFEGAGEGRYPNSTRFNIAEIVSQPILLRVYRDNHLNDYLPVEQFNRSVYILESNRDYQMLAAAYEARLADTKLSPIDRERIQKEFELRRKTITKNEYAIFFTRPIGVKEIPETVARKVLGDVLNAWAEFAVNQQHVITYQVSILSPDILRPTDIEQRDLIAAIQVLRTKANRVSENAAAVQRLPGANLTRTPTDHVSLDEVQLRLEEIVRFRLDPLVATVRAAGLLGDPNGALRFMEAQLAYDQRAYDAQKGVADSVLQSITMYERPSVPQTTATNESRMGETARPASGTSGEAVMLSDTFLDRMMTLTDRAADAAYRQRLIEEYRGAVTSALPLQKTLAYDRQVIQDLRAAGAGGARIDAAAARAEIDRARADIGVLITKVNELFQLVSRNMTPSTQLFSLTGPPVTRTVFAVNPARLALYGVLLLLAAIPLLIAGSLLHNRVSEENAIAASQSPHASE